MAGNNPHSFLHVGKPEIDLPPGIDPYDDRVYRQGAENFRRLMADGVFFRTPPTAFTFTASGWGITSRPLWPPARQWTTMTPRSSGSTNSPGRTRKTTAPAMSANSTPRPALSSSRITPGPTLDARIEAECRREPEYHFTSADGIEHWFWGGLRPRLDRGRHRHLPPDPHLYVADGHHRSAAASHVRRMRRDANPRGTPAARTILSWPTSFPTTSSGSWTTTAWSMTCTDWTRPPFCSGWGRRLTWRPRIRRPERRHEFRMFLDGRWHRLSPPAGHVPRETTRCAAST